MADEGAKNDLEKTEEATPKRREEARKKGQFPKSRNLIPAAGLIAVMLALRFGGEELVIRMERCIIVFFSMAGHLKPIGVDDVFELSLQTGMLLAPVLLLLFGGIVVASLGSGFLQTGFVLAGEPLHFDLGRINPLSGFKRLFSVDALAETVKALLLIGGLGFLGGMWVYADLPAVVSLSGFSTEDIVFYVGREGVVLTTRVVMAMATLAGLDYLYQYWRTESQLRMSRQEIKEEMREQEGDPQLKGHLKGLRQKMSRRRLAADVAKADVVITNPTHLAVALGYKSAKMSAPRVLGKGAGFIAEQIRSIAREKGIPIVENKPLARLLYSQVDAGREIPEAFYRAVAEVLAYVYRLRRGERVTPPKSGAHL